MSRPLRLELAGGIYHITSRGDGREAIYLDDADRGKWIELLGKVCRRFNWKIHGYCLMTNHYHFIVETIEGNLSNGMRQLNGVYTQHFNHTHHRVGHVFQGRYKGILIEKEAYLLEASRYVVLNPVRARMVNNAEDWPWSSYQAMVGQQVTEEWLVTDWLLSQFSVHRKRAIAKYIAFVREGVGLTSLWIDKSHQIFLGNEVFVKAMQKTFNKGADLRVIPRTQCRPMAKPSMHYLSRYKDKYLDMVEAYLTGDYTMKDIVDTFSVHYSTVSRAINKSEEQGA